MKLSDISITRLRNQQILGQKFSGVNEIVQWMCAMQAQDFAMAKWAIGARSSNITDKHVETAINKGEILRTHLLRPTWHFVSSQDINWILDLTSPQIRTIMKSGNSQMGLTDAVIAKSNTIIGNLLSDGRHASREELVKELNKANIRTDENRASHLFLSAELDKVICSGSIKNNKQTYALYDKRVAIRKSLPKEEALVKLAERYFQSHGPATLQDYTWWSGLPVKDAKAGLECIKQTLIPLTSGSETFWHSGQPINPESKPKSVHLIPAFDEFVISYKSRDIYFNSENYKSAVSSNGIFRPVIVINGQVSGLWTRSFTKDKAIIVATLFRPHTSPELKQIEKACKAFGEFTGRTVEFNYITSNYTRK